MNDYGNVAYAMGKYGLKIDRLRLIIWTHLLTVHTSQGTFELLRDANGLYSVTCLIDRGVTDLIAITCVAGRR